MTTAAEAVQLWRGVLVPLAVIPVAGVAGGALWARWADPAAFTVTRLQTSMGEEQLARYFDVEVRYAAIGLVAGFAVAAALTVWLRRTGWPLVVGVVLGGVAAAALSFWVGVALGPPAVEGAFADAVAGDAVPVPLDVETPGLFLSWAVGGLAGLVVVVSVTDREQSLNRVSELHLPDLPRG